MIKYKKISAEDQREYQCYIGILLFLFKYLTPDIANATKEPPKAKNGASLVTFNECYM